MGASHPLVEMLHRAAQGSFPPPNGEVRVIGSPPGRSDAVVAFTAHHVIAADVDPVVALARLQPDDLGAPMKPPFLAWLGGVVGTKPGMLDVVLVAPREPTEHPERPVLVERDPSDHPRVDRAVRYREDVRVFADQEDRAVLMLGRGLAGRWEVSLEIDQAHRGRGLGRSLVRAATRLVPDHDPLFAQVSPGNVASLRAFLAAGYRPIAAEVLFLKAEGPRPWTGTIPGTEGKATR